MSKWQKIDPAEIKVGDLVKVRHVSDAYEATTSAVATNVTDLQIGVGPYNLYKNEGTWYIRKPKKAKPPTRPDEPPVGSFFRVDRTGGKFLAIEPNGDYRYLVLNRATDDWPSDTRPWDEITEPGDTLTMLELREEEK